MVGLWVFRRRRRRARLSDTGVDAAVAGLVGGLAGAKLLDLRTWGGNHCLISF
jgi:hypothetical protein